MRVSVVVGRTSAGGWDVLAMPDKHIEDQKQLVKAAMLSGGRIGEGRKGKQYVELMRFEKYAKRVRFPGGSVEVAPVEL